MPNVRMSLFQFPFDAIDLSTEEVDNALAVFQDKRVQFFYGFESLNLLLVKDQTSSVS